MVVLWISKQDTLLYTFLQDMQTASYARLKYFIVRKKNMPLQSCEKHARSRNWKKLKSMSVKVTYVWFNSSATVQIWVLLVITVTMSTKGKSSPGRIWMIWFQWFCTVTSKSTNADKDQVVNWWDQVTLDELATLLTCRIATRCLILNESLLSENVFLLSQHSSSHSAL